MTYFSFSTTEATRFGRLRSGILAGFLLFFAVTSSFGQGSETLRPPSVPLIAHDPYFSIWSPADRLTDEPTKHWTGADHSLTGLIRIDGKTYRFMGSWPRDVPALAQTGLDVWPTRTIYHFRDAGMELTVTFLTPALPHDLDVLSRPVTYVNLETRAIDGKPHATSLYFDVTAQLAVDRGEQKVEWARFDGDGSHILRVGTAEQDMLSRSGDDLRIDWGYAYLVIPEQAGADDALFWADSLRNGFIAGQPLPAQDDLEMPRHLYEGKPGPKMPTLAATFDLSNVGADPVTRQVLVAYDDIYSIEYFHRTLRPYWRRNGMGAAELFQRAIREYPDLNRQVQAFDEALVNDLKAAGGESYARIAVLAYRQALAAHKLVADFDGHPLYFSKENFSNGSIGTVDVTYPSAPLFMLLNPSLLKGMMDPIFEYARSAHWPFPFAPHDVGQYPLANGQLYGGGAVSEVDQMPVEESGNMLIMAAALAVSDGNADYAGRNWDLLTRWAEYLREKGMDPENQLSTDDFTGHLAHNANLSLKAILALGSYARLAEQLGHKDVARTYRKEAESMAARWVQMADDGDHYRLAFDKPGTWSQKYNLVWDRLLDLNLFPVDVARKELAFYKTRQRPYGLPLDNRSEFTKLDWIIWTATLAENRDDFEALVDPVLKFLNETPDRVPMTDWYWTTDAKQRGFQARSVVGGVFIKMLAAPSLWKKWAGKTSNTTTTR